MNQTKLSSALGWTAVTVSTLIASLWAFWGAIENFHEGWYFDSFWKNVAMMFGQYYIVMIIFLALALVSLRRPRVGGPLHALLGLSLPFWFGRNLASVGFISTPLVLLGVLWWIGRPTPVKRAYQIIIAVPLIILVGFSVEPAIRVAGRIDDGDRDARRVVGNGVDLVWAPEGPGWSNETRGASWHEARRRALHLTADGKSLADTAQHIWRLPTIEEAVRSMARHGANCGGVWNEEDETADYETMPDKESPLWIVHSPIIYWWTETEKNDSLAYFIAYNGRVLARLKERKMGSLGFRSVRTLEN